MVLHRHLKCQKILSTIDWHRISSLNDEEILAICSLAYNFASGNVSLTMKEKEALEKFKTIIIKLAATNANNEEKKQILNQNKHLSAELIKTLTLMLNCKIKSKKVK